MRAPAVLAPGPGQVPAQFPAPAPAPAQGAGAGVAAAGFGASTAAFAGCVGTSKVVVPSTSFRKYHVVVFPRELHSPALGQRVLSGGIPHCGACDGVSIPPHRTHDVTMHPPTTPECQDERNESPRPRGRTWRTSGLAQARQRAAHRRRRCGSKSRWTSATARLSNRGGASQWARRQPCCCPQASR
jgi:hypothetical protein